MEKRLVKEKKFWERFAFRYDLFIKKVVHVTYSSIIEQISLELSKKLHVLEIGTGTGIISFAIHSRVASVTAIDISPAMIRIAQQKQRLLAIENICFQVMDSYYLTLKDKSFDVVIATNLLHLLYEPDKALQEVGRVLKDDGIFIAPTFCVGENMKSRIITKVAEVISGFRTVHKWSIAEYSGEMMSKGWKIEKAKRIDGRFPLAFLVLTKETVNQSI